MLSKGHSDLHGRDGKGSPSLANEKKKGPALEFQILMPFSVIKGKSHLLQALPKGSGLSRSRQPAVTKESL